MYAQHRSTANVPKNYSGNAFRYPPIGGAAEPPEEVNGLNEVLPPTPPAVHGTNRPLPPPTDDPSPSDPTSERPLPPCVAPSAGYGHLRGALQAIGSEELLLIGLFLLLSGHADGEQTQTSDLLFYLLLLFFCG